MHLNTFLKSLWAQWSAEEWFWVDCRAALHYKKTFCVLLATMQVFNNMENQFKWNGYYCTTTFYFSFYNAPIKLSVVTQTNWHIYMTIKLTGFFSLLFTWSICCDSLVLILVHAGKSFSIPQTSVFNSPVNLLEVSIRAQWNLLHMQPDFTFHKSLQDSVSYKLLSVRVRK